MSKKIVCLVGTRPECIKMAPVILEARKRRWAQVIVVSTGQHRELVNQTLQGFSISVDYNLDVMEKNQTLASLSARVLSRLDELLENQTCDLILVQGDTTSVMMASLAAFYRRVPIAHVEAGLRTHDIRRPFPEELNRVITGLVADLHFAPTEQARANLIAERVEASSVHVTGNTVVDALLNVASRDIPCSFPTQSGQRLILVTAHRRENFGEPLRNICAAIRDLHEIFHDVEFVYPVHPNPNIDGPVRTELSNMARVHLIPPADYQDLVMLMKRATLILTDSGGIQEEAPALGRPVLVLRDETERPEAVIAGVARVVGTDRERIMHETSRLLTDPDAYAQMARGGSPYGDGHAAVRILDLCQAYLYR